MSSYSEFCALCDEIKCEYSVDVPLKDYTSFKIGGKADIIAFPDTADKVIAVADFARSNSIPLLVIGKGSNLLVSDDGFRGVVINTCRLDKIEFVDDTTICCQSGASLSRLCRFALENSLTGLEFAFGIPGTAGGAAYMNAGAYGGEMKDVLVRCEHISPNGVVGAFEAADLELSYRHSV